MIIGELFTASLVFICWPNPQFGTFPEDSFVPAQECFAQVCRTRQQTTLGLHRTWTEIIGDTRVYFRAVPCHNI